MKKILSFSLFLLLAFSVSSFAKKLPIVIEAQHLTFDKANHKAIYVGNVIVKKDDLTITGDKLIIYFDKTGKVVEKIEMVGNVKFESPKGNGECEKLEYFPGQEKIVLIGDAKLTKDKNILVGDKIVIFKDGNVMVEGIKQKVKTVIFLEGSNNDTN